MATRNNRQPSHEQVTKVRGLRAGMIWLVVATLAPGLGCQDEFEVRDDGGSGGEGQMKPTMGGMGGDPDETGQGTGGDSSASGGMGGAQDMKPIETPMKECSELETLCDDECVQPSTDPMFCGAECESGERGEVCGSDELCVNGKCELNCPEPLVVCFDECVDPATNDLFCGATGECASAQEQGDYCDEDATCVQGECLTWSDPLTVDDPAGAFCSAIRDDGVVMWGATSESGTRYRLFPPEGGAPSGWSAPAYSNSSPSLSVDCEFEPSTGVPVMAFSHGVEPFWYLAFYDEKSGLVADDRAKVANPVPLLLSKNRGAKGVTFIRNDNHSDSIDAMTLGEDAEILVPDFVVGKDAALDPGSATQVRDLMVSGWRSEAGDEARTRIIQDGGPCCDSIPVSSNEASEVRAPVVGMDDAQNVLAVWAETGGNRWGVRALRIESSADTPDKWTQTTLFLDEGASDHSPEPVLVLTPNGLGLAAWVRQEGDESWIAYASYNPETQKWSETIDLEVSVDPGQPLLALALNSSGGASLSWKGENQQLYSSLLKSVEGRFSTPVSLASDAEGFAHVEALIDERGRAYVFWQKAGDQPTSGMRRLLAD